MHDATAKVRQRHPFAVTPMMPTLDLEYADDTVLIARTAEIANEILHAVEAEAAKYGLYLNKAKTCRIACDSEELVHFTSGEPVPRVVQTVYLGAIIHENSDPGPEIKSRIGRARAICTALRPLWGARALDRKDSMKVLTQCVFSALTYGLHTLYAHKAWEARIDAFQANCARRALRIKTTYAAKLTGDEPVTNKEVMARAGLRPLSKNIMAARFRLAGHVLRRPTSDPARAVAFDRFANPRVIRAQKKPGDQRLKWTTEVLRAIEEVLEAEGLLQVINGGKGSREARTAQLAQDRQAWAKWIKRWAKKMDSEPAGG